MNETGASGVLPDRVAWVLAAIAVAGGVVLAGWLELGLVGRVLLVLVLLAALGRAAATVLRT